MQNAQKVWLCSTENKVRICHVASLSLEGLSLTGKVWGLQNSCSLQTSCCHISWTLTWGGSCWVYSFHGCDLSVVLFMQPFGSATPQPTRHGHATSCRCLLPVFLVRCVFFFWIEIAGACIVSAYRYRYLGCMQSPLRHPVDLHGLVKMSKTRSQRPQSSQVDVETMNCL